MPCKGLHCSGCRHGGGGAVGLAVVVVLVLIAAIGKAVGSALAEAGHVLAVVLEVAVIGLAALAVAAVAAVLTWAAVRVHRRYASRAAAAVRRPLGQPIQAVAEVVQAEPQAIEAPKPRPDLYLNPRPITTERK